MAKKKEVKKKDVLKMTPSIDNEVTDLNYYDDHMYMTNSTLKMFTDKCPRAFQYVLNNPIKDNIIAAVQSSRPLSITYFGT